MIRFNLEPAAEQKERPTKSLRLFSEVSEGTPATLIKAESIVEHLPALPADPYDAGMAIKKYLVDSGFVYDNTAFLLPDILKKKAGNCLGLSALIGGVLEARGYSPEYEVILNPHDAVYRMDLKLFESLEQGDYFEHHDPKLPEEISDFHDYRFVPLEHPALILAGKRFETTSLDTDVEERPENWSKMQADRLTKITYKELCGAVMVDRARVTSDYTNRSYAEVKNLLIRGLRIWPGNREGYSSAKDIAEANFDDEFRETAAKKYLEIGGDDPRFYFTRYEWKGDPQDLDRALKQYPAFMHAYLAKNVDLAKGEGDARFAFSVAAFCHANSGELDIRNLYLQYGSLMAKWLGKKEYLRLSKKLRLAAFNPSRHALIMSDLGDATALPRYILRNGWPKTPKEQTLFAVAGKGLDPSFRDKLVELKEKFGSSKSFQQMVEG